MKKNNSFDVFQNSYNMNDRYIDFDFQCRQQGVNVIANLFTDRRTEFQGQEELDRDISRLYALQQAQVSVFGEYDQIVEDLEEEFSTFDSILVATVGEELARSVYMPSDVTEMATESVLDEFQGKKEIPFIADDPYGEEVVGFQIQTSTAVLSYVYFRHTITKSDITQPFRGRIDGDILNLLTPVMPSFWFEDLGVKQICPMQWEVYSRDRVLNCSQGVAFYKEDRRFVVERDHFFCFEVEKDVVYTRDGIPIMAVVNVADGKYRFLAETFRSTSKLVLDLRSVGKTGTGVEMFLCEGERVRTGDLTTYTVYKDTMARVVTFNVMLDYDFQGEPAVSPSTPLYFERKVLNENLNSLNPKVDTWYSFRDLVENTIVNIQEQNVTARIVPPLVTRLSRSPYLPVAHASMLLLCEKRMRPVTYCFDVESDYVFFRSDRVLPEELFFYQSYSGFYTSRRVVHDLNLYRKIESKKIRFDVLNVEFMTLCQGKGLFVANELLKKNVLNMVSQDHARRHKEMLGSLPIVRRNRERSPVKVSEASIMTLTTEISSPFEPRDHEIKPDDIRDILLIRPHEKEIQVPFFERDGYPR